MYLRILLLTLCLVFGASAQSGEQTPANKEAVGLGAGALIGGLIGGPPGAILGALGGAWFGNRDARNSESIGALESELNGRDEALAQLRAELAQVDRPTRDVIVATRHTGAETLPNGLSFNVAFSHGQCISTWRCRWLPGPAGPIFERRAGYGRTPVRPCRRPR